MAFDKTYRTKLQARIRELAKDHKRAAIAEILNKEGFKRQNGSAINTQFVHNQFASMATKRGMTKTAFKPKTVVRKQAVAPTKYNRELIDKTLELKVPKSMKLELLAALL